MSINLPTTNHPARQHIDLAILIPALAPENRGKLITLRSALDQARRFFADEPAAREVFVVCRKANDSLVLERIGKRGGHSTVWTFTK